MGQLHSCHMLTPLATHCHWQQTWLPTETAPWSHSSQQTSSQPATTTWPKLLRPRPRLCNKEGREKGSLKKKSCFDWSCATSSMHKENIYGWNILTIKEKNCYRQPLICSRICERYQMFQRVLFSLSYKLKITNIVCFTLE